MWADCYNIYMEVAGYDSGIVEKYHGNRYVNVKVTKFVKNT